MTANHTPGPWDYRPDSSKHGEFVIGPANSAPTASNVVAFAVLPHNAPLIAAAPDLLAALEALVKWMDDSGLSHPRPAGAGYFSPFLVLVRDARAAIAKAEGKG